MHVEVMLEVFQVINVFCCICQLGGIFFFVYDIQEIFYGDQCLYGVHSTSVVLKCPCAKVVTSCLLTAAVSKS